MRSADLLVIRIPVWRTTEVEASENNRLTGTMLVCAFLKNYPAARYVQKECLAAIERDNWNREAVAFIRQQPNGFVLPPLFPLE